MHHKKLQSANATDALSRSIYVNGASVLYVVKTDSWFVNVVVAGLQVAEAVAMSLDEVLSTFNSLVKVQRHNVMEAGKDEMDIYINPARVSIYKPMGGYFEATFDDGRKLPIKKLPSPLIDESEFPELRFG